jgi:hypothetical protein
MTEAERRFKKEVADREVVVLVRGLKYSRALEVLEILEKVGIDIASTSMMEPKTFKKVLDGKKLRDFPFLRALKAPI